MRKLTKAARNLLTVVGICFSWFIIGFVVARGLNTGDYQKGFEAGKSKALKELSLKAVLLVDDRASAKLCTQWWFGMSHKDRSLR